MTAPRRRRTSGRETRACWPGATSGPAAPGWASPARVASPRSPTCARAPAPLLDLLGDPTPASDEALPDTGVPREWERALSSVFIQTDDYGTRSSTALLIGHSGDVTFVERTFEEGTPAGDRRFSFRIGREGEKERK